MPIVFVTQIPARKEGASWVPTISINDARNFGEPRVIFPMGMNISVESEALPQLRAALVDFDPKEDFLLPIGDPLLIHTACALLGRRFEQFRVLKWDRLDKCYYYYTIFSE